jgi:hypothetical protein
MEIAVVHRHIAPDVLAPEPIPALNLPPYLMTDWDNGYPIELTVWPTEPLPIEPDAVRTESGCGVQLAVLVIVMGASGVSPLCGRRYYPAGPSTATTITAGPPMAAGTSQARKESLACNQSDRSQERC